MSSDPATVMLVEDELMLQDVYKLVLESNGFKVVTADNGREALAKIKKTCPSVVVLDMLMPVMSGKDFMRTINLEEYPDTRIIVYSNLSDSAVEAEMLELGADKFILKSSMTPLDLVQMIRDK